MRERSSRLSVRKSDLDRLLRALRRNGLNPTGAEIQPNGTVRVFTDEPARTGEVDDTAFDAWWREHGQAG
jgi:hypothetical protein